MKRLSNIIKLLLVGLGISFFAFAPALVQAGTIDIRDEFETTLIDAGFTGDLPEPEDAVGKVINQFLTYIGVGILVLIIYAGFLWATAAGNETKIGKAKKILIGSVIGLVIVFAASAIVNFVINQLGESLGG